MDDRRKHHRKKIAFPVRVSSAGGAQPFRAECLDLSVGGMGLVSKVAVEKEAVLQLEFSLASNSASSTPFRVTAIVRLVRQMLQVPEPRFAVGVEFLKLTAEQKRILESEVMSSLFMI